MHVETDRYIRLVNKEVKIEGKFATGGKAKRRAYYRGFSRLLKFFE